MTRDSGVLDAPLQRAASAAELSSLMQQARLRSVVLTIGEERVWDRELTPEVAESFLDRLGVFMRDGSDLARTAFAYSCTVVINGREPFADMDSLLRVANAAKRQMFFVQTQTWARWTPPEMLSAAVRRVKGAIDQLAVSVSATDMRLNGVKHVAALIAACREHGLTPTIYLMLDDGNDWPPELLALKELNEDTIIINTIPMYHVAPSEDNDDTGLLLTQIPGLYRCRERFGFYVDPHCDVYPCSAMVGQPDYCMANILRDDLETILATTLGRRDVEQLSREGPEFLRVAADAEGLSSQLPTHFVDACDFHRRFMSIDSLRETAARLAVSQNESASL